jgi:hypothetical protein
MHSSVEELAQTHDIPESIIRDFIQKGKWARIEHSSQEGQLEALQEKLKTVSIYNQNTLVKSFMSLQNKVLQVSHNLLDQVTELSDAPLLKIVSEVIELHRPHILMTNKKGENPNPTDTGLKIQIISQFGEGREAVVNAVQISESAGLTNGVGTMQRLSN